MFSGLISRAEAEELLGEDVEVGAFLVRLSDKVFGYTISFKDEERIKHFLIDASKPKKVKFDGSAEKTHKDLAALVEYHQVGNREIKEESDDYFRFRRRRSAPPERYSSILRGRKTKTKQTTRTSYQIEPFLTAHCTF